ncbi:unnamed protein product [Didymodactylos carnosus]|uniref:Uncharacterized protein n=1 Tax=Didymodactylos carnosus TaxID=1234261 RepID=A0A8S2NUX5_9BILA|nr:unnamed protein product [Didymodactylos carnosus]CAF4019746.1 unnamed protein product [Didymodactylos carnosus]
MWRQSSLSRQKLPDSELSYDGSKQFKQVKQNDYCYEDNAFPLLEKHVRNGENHWKIVENKMDLRDILTKLDNQTDRTVNEFISTIVDFINDIGKPVVKLATHDKVELTKIMVDYVIKLRSIEERLHLNFQFEDMPTGPNRLTTNEEVNSDISMINNSLLTTTIIPNQRRTTTSVEIEVRNDPEENTNIVSLT